MLLFAYARRRPALTPRGPLSAALAVFCAAMLLALPALAETLRVGGLEGIRKVQVFGNVEAEIGQGPAAELQFRGSADRLSPPPFYRSGDTLVLGRSAENPGQDIRGIQYRLTLPALEVLQVQGSAEVYLRPLEVHALRVSLDGSSDLRLFDVAAQRANFSLRGSGDLHIARLQADDLKLSVAGSGDLKVGEVRARDLRAVINGSGDIGVIEDSWSERLDISVVGSGDADFLALDGENFRVRVIGSGRVRLGASQRLEVDIMGSGDVDYRGDPQLEQSIIGSGDLRRKP